jgi:TatA/E family protein of Tat protein translocase
MFNIGPEKLLVILVVVLVVFGPEKLPEVGRQAARVLRDFRKFQEAMQANVRDIVEPLTGPIIPNSPTLTPPINGEAVPRLPVTPVATGSPPPPAEPEVAPTAAPGPGPQAGSTVAEVPTSDNARHGPATDST